MRLIDADEIRIKPDFIFHGVCGTPVIRCEDLARIINDMPTIEPQKWISCDKRLPEEETDVLVTRTFLGCKDGSHRWNNHIPPKTYVEVAQYFNGEWTALSDEYKVARNRHTDPVAWMPLPEPYKGEEE